MYLPYLPDELARSIVLLLLWKAGRAWEWNTASYNMPVWFGLSWDE